jgi:hypothetical protein
LTVVPKAGAGCRRGGQPTGPNWNDKRRVYAVSFAPASSLAKLAKNCPASFLAVEIDQPGSKLCNLAAHLGLHDV